jgi:4a-hydroxytetrahydrobiopterin dehydratase
MRFAAMKSGAWSCRTASKVLSDDWAAFENRERRLSRESENTQSFNMAKLTKTEIASALRKIGGWTVANDKLHRDYQFADFVHAFGFMAMAALIIEKMDHHPEWSNVYNRLSVDLTTHDAGGITKKDVDLASALETLAKRFI